MGRKSRIKSDRKKEVAAQVLYRLFKEEEHADALVSGKVWLSTLKKCRAYEDPEQGDPEEAHEIYNSGYAIGDSDDPNLKERARRSGLDLSPGIKDVTISNNIKRTVLEDAYVICATSKSPPDALSSTFGQYCVQITNPQKFFKIISASLKKKTQIKWEGHRPIDYKQRLYSGMEPPPGQIGFVKPEDGYKDQEEYRFLWVPQSTKLLEPFSLYCPDISPLCKRITISHVG